MRWVPLVRRVGYRKWEQIGSAAVETHDGRGPELFVDSVEAVGDHLYPMYKGRSRSGYRVVGAEYFEQEELW